MRNKHLFAIVIAIITFTKSNAQYSSLPDAINKKSTTTQRTIANELVKEFWSKAFGENADLRVGFGVRTLPTKSGEAFLRYVDQSPSRDSLSGSIILGGMKAPVFYELGYRSRKHPHIGFGFEGYVGTNCYSILGYLEMNQELKKASKHPTMVGIRASFGGARWSMGEVPRNGIYYKINGNIHYSTQNLNIKYRDNVATISPSISKEFTRANGKGIYLKAAANISFKMTPEVELSGIDTQGNYFNERVKFSDSAVSFTHEDRERKKAPVYYSGVTLAVGFRL